MEIPTLFRKGYIFRRGGMARHKRSGTWTEQKNPRRLFIRCPACDRILDVTQYSFVDAGNAKYTVKYAQSCSHCPCGHVYNFALLGYRKPDPEGDRVISLVRQEMAKACESGGYFYALCNIVNGIAISVSITMTDRSNTAAIYRTQPGGHYTLGATGLRLGRNFETLDLAIETAVLALMGKLQ